MQPLSGLQKWCIVISIYTIIDSSITLYADFRQTSVKDNWFYVFMLEGGLKVTSSLLLLIPAATTNRVQANNRSSIAAPFIGIHMIEILVIICRHLALYITFDYLDRMDVHHVWLSALQQIIHIAGRNVALGTVVIYMIKELRSIEQTDQYLLGTPT